MSYDLFTIQAGQNFLSTEMKDFLSIMVVGLPNWKWLILTLTAIGLLLIRKLIVWIIIKLKKARAYFPQQTFMSFLLDLEIEKGLSWVVVSFAGLIIVDSLNLTPSLDKYLTLSLKLFLSFNVIRICYLAAEALGLSIQKWSESTSSDLDDHLAPLISKTMKVAVVVIGALIALQNFGINVTALLAGLGIGGVAIAFAAQDTVSNVFGTITILLDAPFKMGDVVKIGDTEGSVSEIGFRSTRIKTYYNSVITLPNSIVAKERIDNLTKREGWIRFQQSLGFTYAATPQQIHSFAERMRAALAQDSTVDQERITISLSAFADFSVNALVNFHYKLGENETIFARNGEYLKLIYDTSQSAQLEFAYPTQTLIMQNSTVSN